MESRRDRTRELTPLFVQLGRLISSLSRIARCPAAPAGMGLIAWQLLTGGSTLYGQSAVAEKPVDSETAPAAAPAAKVKPQDAEPKLGSDWVRLKLDDKRNPVGMQTAIVRYTRPAKNGDAKEPPVVVDLIGAVHIADRDYYRQLNERFKKYDALLYELVAPEGTVVERGRGTSNANPVGAIQNGIKVLLELDHQLEEVDYTKPNFVHADLSPDQFFQAMRDRNESFLQMYFRLLGQAMAQQSDMAARGESLDFDLFSALFSDDRPRRLKIALAKQLSDMESMMVSFGGDQGSVLITERNKRALKVLREQIDAGKKQLGVFYGAGHLNDMDERLRKDFGLEPSEITWVTAWDLSAKK